MRRFFTLLAFLAIAALVPASCTMPHSYTGQSTKKSSGPATDQSDPKIVDSERGDIPMLQGEGSARENVLRGTQYND